jgi:3-isopropylmalate dehydrogenase
MMNIAILEGDGIGPEIMREGVKVIEAISKKYGRKFDLVYADFGAQSYFKNGNSFPESSKKICDKADAIIKGPIGLSLKEMVKIPLKVGPEAGLLELRKRYDTYANYRPIYLPKQFSEFSPLKPETIGVGINIMMIRELVGGIYFGKKEEGSETKMKYSRDDCIYTKEQVERFAHLVFKEAMNKNVKLTNVHKANILATSRFWNNIFEEVRKKYPTVKYESMLVDNVAYQLVKRPTQFNGIMALENMQGDILTDEAGGILGSLGLMPSACLNPESKKGYYEPSHGSAPDIAGKDIANPYSMIGSFALMLDKSFGLKKESDVIWNALTKVFSDGYRTSELATKSTPKNMIVSTSKFGDLVVENILR